MKRKTIKTKLFRFFTGACLLVVAALVIVLLIWGTSWTLPPAGREGGYKVLTHSTAEAAPSGAFQVYRALSTTVAFLNVWRRMLQWPDRWFRDFRCKRRRVRLRRS